MMLLNRRTQKIEKLIVLTFVLLLIYFNFNYSYPKLKDDKSNGKHKTFKVNEESQNTWTRISDSLYVYSAFVETRENHGKLHIKIIGIKKVSFGSSSSSSSTATQKHKKDFSKQATQQSGVVQLIPKVTDLAESKYYCKLFYEHGENVGSETEKDNVGGKYLKWIKSEKLTYFVFEEGVKRFAGSFFKCHFPNEILSKLQKTRLFVALYPLNVADYPDKLIPVRMREDGIGKRDLSICVRPLFGPFNDLSKIVEFISYYETMGVSSFTFYYISMSPSIKEFLEQLENIQIFHWNLPTGNPKELWDYGTLSALQDCMYRNSGYVIIVDIDEFIVPRRYSSLIELVRDSGYEHVYQFSIRNTFFCKEFCSHSNYSQPFPLLTASPADLKSRSSHAIDADRIQYANSSTGLKHNGPGSSTSNRIGSSSSTYSSSASFSPSHDDDEKLLRNFQIFSCPRRTKKIWGMYNRAKYIARADKVLSLGHHYVTTFLNYTDTRFSKYTMDVPSSVALLNHYRECRSISSRTNPIYRRASVTDTRIQEFGTEMKRSTAFQLYKKLLDSKLES